MNSRRTVLNFTPVLVVGLVLILGDPGIARQNIEPSGRAIKAGPSATSGIAILVSHNVALLSWQPSKDPRVEGYYVWSGTDPKKLTPKKVGKVTSYTVSKLEQGQTWYFAVSSYGRIGKSKVDSEWSSILSKYIPAIQGKKH